MHVNSDVKTRVPAGFLEYLGKIKALHEIKSREPGGADMREAGQWWARVDDSMRVYLLSTLAGDEWEKFVDVRWVGLPDGLRAAISLRARVMERQLRFCPWR